MTHSLAPKFTAHEAREKLGDTPNWVNFALRIQHNPEIKRSLILVQTGRCPVCAMPVTMEDTVHHVSYMARCRTQDSVSFPAPTAKRPDRVNLAPPCKGCPEQARCLRLLRLVHDRCHRIIHAD